MKMFKKLFNNFKGMSIVDKYVTILSCIVLILLIANIISNINYLSRHEQKIQVEDTKIIQIEEKLMQYEDRINNLEKKLQITQGGNKQWNG